MRTRPLRARHVGRRGASVILLGAGVGALISASACSGRDNPAETTFFSRKIQPVFETTCSRSPAGSSCHVDADGKGNALGNLSLESYQALEKRRDLLVDYGPYGLPGLLLKAVPPTQLRLRTWDGKVQSIKTDVAHAGGSAFDLGSAAFTQLERWIEDGATEGGTKAVEQETRRSPCSSIIGEDVAFDASSAAPADFATFESKVAPVLSENCAAGNCHGARGNPLYLTCGETADQRRWNHFAAADYVAKQAEDSDLLRRSLAPARGGVFHEGGTIFSTPDDPGYRALRDWATERGGPTSLPTAAGFGVFAERVQPMLVKRGCMQLGCHSPSMFHKYPLRGGGGGLFSLASTRQNYLSTLEMVALESPEPNASRLLRKNLAPSAAAGGILHRGGPLFGSPDPAACDPKAALEGPLDEQTPYCVLRAWINKEREARMSKAAPFSQLVYVSRPAPLPGTGGFQDYADYAPGASLLRRTLTRAANGALSVGDTAEELLTRCKLDPAKTDVRRPSVSWDGQRIAFAARSSATSALKVYVLEADGSCALEPTVGKAPTDDTGKALPLNGELVHDFDPAFAPDGRLVFASTRGNVTNAAAFEYQGPQRSTADPAKPNANLYVVENGKIRQLTFLLNQERHPTFMHDGRLLLVTEKRAPGFYQLAGRRLNLDGGDYHPLFGQRRTIGFDQLTDVVELTDQNLAFIVSDRGATQGAGALGFVNRSLGVDQRSERPEDYPADANAPAWPNYNFYQRSFRTPDGAATGRVAATDGAYRSPSPLPDGRVLVAYSPTVKRLDQAVSGFGIVVVDPASGARTTLVPAGGRELESPVAVFARPPREVFRSRISEANGAVEIFTDQERRKFSDVTLIDAGTFASLLFQNTRTGRPIPTAAGPLNIWESLPPGPGVKSFADGGEFVTEDEHGKLYVRRRPLGTVKLYEDGSGRFRIPGGMPVVLETAVQLTGDSAPVSHFQREELQFYPGEWVRQSFRRDLFNGVCAGCHGSISGREMDVAVKPDILTKASDVIARGAEPDLLTSALGAPVGPPFR